MTWEALYNDWSEYNSTDHNWEDLPADGMIKVTITFPSGGKMVISGWDFYALEEVESGIKASYWKDTISNDINGDPIDEPYLNKGATRTFFNDGSATGIEYQDADIIFDSIPSNAIKAGRWVEDSIAHEMGIL